jgi:hypothetical protein
LTRLQAKLDAPLKSDAQAARDRLMGRRRKVEQPNAHQDSFNPEAGQAQALHLLRHEE